MKLNYEDINVIREIPPVQPNNSYVVLDVELFGAEKHLLHRPTGEFAALTVTVDEKTVYLLTDKEQVAPTLENIKDSIWVASNLPFDLRHLRRWATISPRKKVYCIETIERILFANYYKLFSVANTARRYCGLLLDKDPVKEFQEERKLTPELEKYSVLDGVAEWMILQEQLKVLQKNPWTFKTWMEIDMPCMWAYLDFYGFRVDVPAWQELYEFNLKESARLKESFDFNPNSPKQVKEYLQKNGFPRLPSTGANVLPKWVKRHPDTKAAEVAEEILWYRKIDKRRSTYGMKFIEPYLEWKDGVQVIFPDYNLSRAITGRESSRLHNIPQREAPEYRKPWIARPGNKLVVADYSSCEPRIHAYLTQDENLIAAFNSGEDVYVKTAELLYGEKITKDHPLRDRMKVAFLATTYGQTTQGIAEKEGISEEEAEDLQDRFFTAFPKSGEWCAKQRKKTTYVETAAGRRCWLNPYREADNERNALNSPHQGSAADILKLAISRMYFEWKFDCPFGMVHQNHDEVILDVPEELAFDVAEYVEYHMVKAGEDVCPGIPFEAKAEIVDNWLEGK